MHCSRTGTEPAPRSPRGFAASQVSRVVMNWARGRTRPVGRSPPLFFWRCRLERSTGNVMASVIPTWRPYASLPGAVCRLNHRAVVNRTPGWSSDSEVRPGLRAKPHAKRPHAQKAAGRPAASPIQRARRYSFSWANTAFPRGRGDILAGTLETQQTDDNARRGRAKIPVRILPRP